MVMVPANRANGHLNDDRRALWPGIANRQVSSKMQFRIC
jgi:hypothetical protein